MLTKSMLLAAWLLLVGSSVLAQSTKQQPNFPTTEEIQLVVSQAERAFEQYKQTIEAEAKLRPSQKNKTALENDRKVAGLADQMIHGLKRNPEIFHGLGGFLLVTTLDDASRNAALCAGADIANSLTEQMADASQMLQVAEACAYVSLQLYTVSENAHALMVRELEGQRILDRMKDETLDKCGTALKALSKKKQ